VNYDGLMLAITGKGGSRVVRAHMSKTISLPDGFERGIELCLTSGAAIGDTQMRLLED
jgi:hypothetical protein